MNNKTYAMYPMSNIGATVSVWREIMSNNHSVAYDCESILDYFAEVFGDQARSPVIVGKETWYMISVHLAEWMEIHGESTVYRVSDGGFDRVDRSR